jgi:outer membrane protein assembly factor BamB
MGQQRSRVHHGALLSAGVVGVVWALVAACSGAATAATAAPAAGAAAGAAAGSSTRVHPVASGGRATHASTSPGDLVTFGYGNSRSNHDTVDPKITTLSARPVWNRDSLDGAVYGQPLVYDGTVYVATENDSVYAIGARSGKVLWHRHLGTSVRTSVIDTAPTLGGGCGDISPLGITGTPVIDPAKGELFVAEETYLPGRQNWHHIRHWLVALSLSSHHVLWHRDIDPPNANNPAHYYIAAEQQRPALTLANGRLYVGFGGLAGDCGQYHGFEVGLADSGKGALLSYQVPSAREAAIWETDGALVTPQGDLYVATGNGASTTKFDEGNAVIELSPKLHRLGVWAPSDWVTRNENDWDLGSSGPIQVPGSSVLFEAGKVEAGSDTGYLLREGHLDGVGRGGVSGSVCTNSSGDFGADASDVIGSRKFIFAACGGGTVAVRVTASPRTLKLAWVVSGGADGSPLVAGGRVWVLSWPGGGLYGINPSTGHVVLTRSTDQLGHFVTPAVGDGMLFVPAAQTGSGHRGGVEAYRTVG